MPTESVPGSPPYPGASQIDVTRVSQRKVDGDQVELTIYVTWDHEGAPQSGLPVWVQVRIQDAAGKPVFNDSAEQFVIPIAFHLLDHTAAFRRRIAGKPGTYTIVVDPAHPEMLASLPHALKIA